MKKTLSLLLIILLLSTLLLFFPEKTIEASYNSKFSNYPGYKELLEELQKEHPNWEFEVLETGLNWEDVVKNETTARHGRSLISKYDGAFDKCATCGNKQYEPGWYCASITAVEYYLDPRNSICEDYIFQFEQLTYDSKNQTEDGVKKILADCNYMQGTVTYYDTAGKKQTINKTYIQIIMEAAKKYNVSPYHIASRIRQEMGTGKGSSMISGTYGSYKGYYNYFNWGAFGDDIMGSGLRTAKKYGWTDPEKAINGGVEKLSQEYIGVGQDTLYLQKFDVVDSGNGCYWHQYMTNVSASKSEGLTTKNAYLKMGMLSKDYKIKFKIPVYKNMPTLRCAAPGKQTIVTQDVKINADNVAIKKEKNTTSNTIATLKKDSTILRIEYTDMKDKDGVFWDKVVLSNGTKGYVQRNYLTEISTQSNCNEKYVVLNAIALRNGPGTDGTNVIKYISAGEVITAIEKEKYANLNGENWYRVKLTDGSYGYVAIGNSKEPNIVKYDETSTEYGYVKVICTDGLNIRVAPTTGASVITTVTEGTRLFRLQKDASNNEGYVWDKVVTESGIVGYLVRQDKTTKEAWIEEIRDISITGKGFKTLDSNFLSEPNITVSTIKEKAKGAVIKKGSKTVADTEKIGTGYTITYDGKTFTIIVKGDTNGDGEVSSADYVRIKNCIRKKETLSSAEKSAADSNGDGDVTSADYVKVKNYLRKKEIIEVK